MRQEDNSHLPADRLARILMDCARQDPSLLGRSRPDVAGPLVAAGGQPLTLNDTNCSVSEYLENLVMIAVDSARDAEATYREASETNRRSRRRELAAVAFCIVGVLAGVTGVIASRLHAGTEAQLADVTATLQTLDARQNQTNGRIAELQSNVDAAAVQTPAVSRPPPLRPPPVTIPVNGLRSVGAEQQISHRGAAEARGYQPVIFPQFFANVRRNMYALLR